MQHCFPLSLFFSIRFCYLSLIQHFDLLWCYFSYFLPIIIICFFSSSFSFSDRVFSNKIPILNTEREEILFPENNSTITAWGMCREWGEELCGRRTSSRAHTHARSHLHQKQHRAFNRSTKEFSVYRSFSLLIVYIIVIRLHIEKYKLR